MKSSLEHFGWSEQGLPLCRRYFAMLVRSVLVCVKADGDEGYINGRWALGVLTDGQCELLGVWPEPASTDDAWRAIHRDLTARGVEAIRYIVGPDSAGLAAAFPGAIVLTSLARLLHPAKRGSRGAYPPPSLGGGKQLALSPRQRCVIEHADEAALNLQAKLDRALIRHGCFDSPESAVAFVESSLQRLEQAAAFSRQVVAPSLTQQVVGRPAATGMQATGA
jgi:hypothetical protein